MAVLLNCGLTIQQFNNTAIQFILKVKLRQYQMLRLI
jgi:hypothetical protein